MKREEPIVIRLERDGEDRLIPKGFGEIIVHQFFPVLSLGYIASVFGISANLGNMSRFLLHDRTAYEMAILVAIWVAVPCLAWVFIRGNPGLRHLADFWYRVIAILMTVTMVLVLLMFPEVKKYGIQLYLVLSIPIMIINYFFFIKAMLPQLVIYPLNALGFCALFYGLLIGIIF